MRVFRRRATAAPAQPEPPDRPAPPVSATQVERLGGGGSPAPDAADRSSPTPQPVAARFTTAAATLRYLGALALAARDDGATVFSGEGAWWVTATVELDVARLLADTAGGRTYLPVDGRLTRDRGPHGNRAGPSTGGVDARVLTEATLPGLIRTAGLQPVAARPLRSAVVLMPGLVAGPLIRRCLDLGHDVEYRPVRLHPLIEAADGPDAERPGSTALIELTLHSRTGPVAASLLAVAADQPLTVVCRAAGPEGELLVQNGLASPLPDDQLAALTAPESWVLADAAFGWWRLEPLAERCPADTLARLPVDFPVENQAPLGEHSTVRSATVRLVPDPRPGQRVDAVLLDDADLATVALLLQRHPLSDIALFVRGRDRHLLLAAGGLLDRLAAGEPLSCIGPGLLYLPLGHRLSPDLPTSARKELFAPDAQHAVVVLGRGALRFTLDPPPVPVWRLWAGPPPQVDAQLPPAARDELARIAERLPVVAAPVPIHPYPVEQPPAESGGSANWRLAALAWEAAGQPGRAAELHRRHGDLRRAGELFERAARLEDGETRRRSVTEIAAQRTPESTR